MFPSVTGTTLDDANIRKAVLAIVKKAEVRKRRSIVHVLRHTFGSLLIQQGESLAYVRDQMGHASIQVTVDIYGHLVPGGNRAAVDRLDSERPAASQAHPATDLRHNDMPLSPFDSLVSRGGIEPPTRRLRVCCSAN